MCYGPPRIRKFPSKKKRNVERSTIRNKENKVMTEKEILAAHIGFATAALKAENNNTKKHILWRLNDAVDAFELGMPDFAYRRIKSICRELKKDIK